MKTGKIKSIKEMTAAELLAELEWVGYECPGGPLQNHVAFIELKKRAKE